MRRILPLFLLSATALLADSLNHRLDVLEAQMQDLRMQTVYGNFGPNTGSGYAFLDSWGLYFGAEAIYWKLFEGGTDYVYENQPNVDVNTMVDTLHYLDEHWRFAYRFTLGYQLDSPDLDLWGTFTRFTTDQTDEVLAPIGLNAALFPNQAVNAGVSNYAKASVENSFAYNVFDINLGRNYFLRKNFSTHPFIGIRGAKIDTRTYLTWEDSPTANYRDKSSNDFWGLGILGGTKGRWHFDKHWSLFGSVLGSLLYGWYGVDLTLAQFYPVVTDPLNLDVDTRRVVPNVATDFGVTWEYIAFKERTRFSLSLAYEFQYWWAYNQMLQTKYNTTYAWTRFGEDFGLQGLKFHFGLDF